jgi:hypothetical protein
VVAPNLVPKLVFVTSYGQLLLLFNASISTSAFWYDSLADSLKQHFWSNGLNRLLGFKPSLCNCLAFSFSSPTKVLTFLVLPTFLPLVSSIKKGLFLDLPLLIFDSLLFFLSGRKQKSSPDVAQTGSIRRKHDRLLVEPINK